MAMPSLTLGHLEDDKIKNFTAFVLIWFIAFGDYPDWATLCRHCAQLGLKVYGQLYVFSGSTSFIIWRDDIL